LYFLDTDAALDKHSRSLGNALNDFDSVTLPGTFGGWNKSVDKLTVPEVTPISDPCNRFHPKWLYPLALGESFLNLMNLVFGVMLPIFNIADQFDEGEHVLDGKLEDLGHLQGQNQ